MELDTNWLFLTLEVLGLLVLAFFAGYLYAKNRFLKNQLEEQNNE